MEGKLVLPGDKVATEEEYTGGANTFTENGVVYASVIGVPSTAEKKVSIVPLGRDVRTIDKNMLVIGTVTDMIKGIVFVKIDNIDIDHKEYLALKDGKILLERPRPRFGRGPPHRAPQKPEKVCSVGDTLLAKVLYNDKDAYTLTLDCQECGVVHATCELCGGTLVYKKEANALVCESCGHKEYRRMSALYDKPEEIRKLFVYSQ
ncbi:MAG: exosome complex RNA-binding protein Csl4 [Candidatus Micrarchaeia archaeon]